MLSKTISKFFLIVLTLGSTAIVTSCTDKPSSSSDNKTTSTTKSTADAPKKSEIAQRVEAAIQKQLFAPNSALADVKSLSCPNEIVVIANSTFACKATAPQGTFKVLVTIKNAQGDMDFNTNGLLMLPVAEQFIQDTIKQKHKIDVAADCGSKQSKIRLFKQVGESFKCDVTQLGNKIGGATITVEDENGQIKANWKIKPAG
ncbi:hypothetical protein NIES4103_66280 [Nostoc sp. NIES-4103]|nr:hypothetical protein NIES4103_66280 [Nostoc sp. NIES-4103]